MPRFRTIRLVLLFRVEAKASVDTDRRSYLEAGAQVGNLKAAGVRLAIEVNEQAESLLLTPNLNPIEQKYRTELAQALSCDSQSIAYFTGMPQLPRRLRQCNCSNG
jgi:hypothetical protein